MKDFSTLSKEVSNLLKNTAEISIHPAISPINAFPFIQCGPHLSSAAFDCFSLSKIYGNTIVTPLLNLFQKATQETTEAINACKKNLSALQSGNNQTNLYPALAETLQAIHALSALIKVANQLPPPQPVAAPSQPVAAPSQPVAAPSQPVPDATERNS